MVDGGRLRTKTTLHDRAAAAATLAPAAAAVEVSADQKEKKEEDEEGRRRRRRRRIINMYDIRERVETVEVLWRRNWWALLREAAAAAPPSRRRIGAGHGEIHRRKRAESQHLESSPRAAFTLRVVLYSITPRFLTTLRGLLDCGKRRFEIDQER